MKKFLCIISVFLLMVAVGYCEELTPSILTPKAKGEVRAQQDIKNGKMKVLYYGKPWSAGKPLVDDESNLPVEIVEGCSITSEFVTETDAYNASMRKAVKAKQVETQPLQLTIKSDKQVYEVGEVIKANISYQGKFYWGQAGPWSIQRWENGSWVLIVKRGDGWCGSIQECKDIKLDKVDGCPTILCSPPRWVGSEEGIVEVLVWDQSYVAEEKTYQCKTVQSISRNNDVVFSGKLEDKTCAVFKQAPPGKYKIRFGYVIKIPEAYVDIKYAEKEILIEQKKSISKEEALAIAKKVCKEQGWEWREKIIILERDGNYCVMTNKPQKGGNAEILIDKKTGEVVNKIFHYK